MSSRVVRMRSPALFDGCGCVRDVARKGKYDDRAGFH